MTRTGPRPGRSATWAIRLDPHGEPRAQPDEVTLAEFSTGALFEFERRGTAG